MSRDDMWDEVKPETKVGYISNTEKLYQKYNDVRVGLPMELQITGLSRELLLQVLAVIIHLEKTHE